MFRHRVSLSWHCYHCCVMIVSLPCHKRVIRAIIVSLSYHCCHSYHYRVVNVSLSCHCRAADALYCPLLVAPMYGEQQCSHPSATGGAYPEGTVCTFSCQAGTSLHGAHNSSCTEHGSWSMEPPTCVGKMVIHRKGREGKGKEGKRRR